MNLTHMKPLSKKQIEKLIIILVLVGVVLPSLLFLTKKRQEIRKEAEEVRKEIVLSLNPRTNNQTNPWHPGDEKTINIKIKNTTSDKTLLFRVVGLELKFDPQVFEIQPSNLKCASPFVLAGGNASKVEGDTISLVCYVPPAGANPSDPQSLAPGEEINAGSFRLKVKQNPPGGTTNITFARTNIPEEGSLEDLSKFGQSGTYYIAGAQITPTPTPISTPTPTPTQRPTSTPTPRPSLIPTPTALPASCNGASVSSNEVNHGQTITYYRGNVNRNNTIIKYRYGGLLPGSNTKCEESSKNTTCEITADYSQGSTIEFGTNINVYSDGKLFICRYDGVWVPEPPNSNPGSTCTNTCRATVLINGPTPTSLPGQVKISFKIRFSEINSKRADQKVKVKIGRKNTIIQEIEEVNLSANDQGIYESQMITLSPEVTQGSNYYLLIKGPKHLQVRFCQNSGQARPCTGGKITLDNGENILDFTNYPLPAGDLPPQDGVVNAIDAVALTNCFETPTSQECLDKADLNLDGIISVADQIIMNNTIYTRWEDE